MPDLPARNREWLWKLPTARLRAILNAYVAVTVATFAQNTAFGLGITLFFCRLSLMLRG